MRANPAGSASGPSRVTTGTSAPSSAAMSVPWKPSSGSVPRSAPPTTSSSGVGSALAASRAMLALVAPGERLTATTAGRPLSRASASAAKAAPASWRAVTIGTPSSAASSSRGRNASPGTVNSRSHPNSSRRKRSRRPATVRSASAVRSRSRGAGAAVTAWAPSRGAGRHP